MKKKGTGVIVGRWQVPYLHIGHLQIIEHVTDTSEKLVLVVGESAIQLTDRNPLPIEVRKLMLSVKYPEADILSIKDSKSDELWSQNLDELLEGYKDVTLYGSRDCFIEHYKGKHKTELIPSTYNVSGTEVRKGVAKRLPLVIVPTAFSEGIIYAIENRFPTVYPTVDIAVVKYDSGTCDHQLLLGRKEGSDKYCFIGGFVDTKDESKEMAAARELSEEVTGMDVHEFKYISSHKINDPRYRGTKDGIMTSLFAAYYLSGTPTAADDIAECRWFDLKGFDRGQITDYHQVLFDALIAFLAEEQYCSYHENTL